MKFPIAFVVVAVLASSAIAEEKSPARATPQPRVRLDHALLAKAEELSRQREVKSEPEPVVEMTPVVVAKRALPSGPRKEKEPKGKFTPLRGGHFLKGEVAETGVEIGIRPYVDIMENEFTPQKKRVEWELVRIRWK